MICGYSHPCVSGVWGVVYNMAKRLAQRGYEIHVFSSNEIFGSNEKSGSYQKYQGIHIHRYPVKWKVGKFGVAFNFEKDLIKLKPDIIHTHVYRAPFSHKALKLARKLKIKCFLTTHAPFVEKKLRGGFTNLMVSFYDLFLGKKDLNNYSKVFAITHWEIPYLSKLGCRQDKIEYLPNGIGDEFLNIKLTSKKKNKVLFLGRIDPIKDIETLINAAILVDRKVKFLIVGPGEEEYIKKLKRLAKERGLGNIEFRKPVYEIKEKVELYKEVDIFVLPSKREAMPLALLEAMACGCLVIGSDNQGIHELIGNKRGILFKTGDYRTLGKKIDCSLKNWVKQKKVRKDSVIFARSFAWKKIVNQLERLYSGK